MGEDKTYLPFDPDWTVPPGAMLLEWAEEFDPRYRELRFWYEPDELEDLVNGRRPLTPDDALILACTTGIRRGFWTRAEQLYREGLAAGKKWRGEVWRLPGAHEGRTGTEETPPESEDSDGAGAGAELRRSIA